MEALTMEVNSTKQQSVGSGVPVRRPYQAPQLTNLGNIQMLVRNCHITGPDCAQMNASGGVS
jgi:hypothetical protein